MEREGNKGKMTKGKTVNGKMRGCMGLSVLLLLAALGTGCGSEGEEAQRGETTEVFGSYTMSPAGVLWVDDKGYLQFYSRESDSAVYLCNQAGCSHQDKNCSAYAENLQKAFFYHDDLYLIQYHDTDLIRVQRANRYGEDRQLLGEMKCSPLSYTMRICDGALYFIGSTWDYEKDNSRQELYALQLEDGTLTTFPNPETGHPISNVSGFMVTDRYLYIQYTACDVDIKSYFDNETGEFEGIDLESIVYISLLYRMDRKTGEMELLMEKAGSELTLLEGEGENFTLRLDDSILRYEGKELAETLYTYSGEEKYWEIKPLGEDYLISEGMPPYQFRFLKDFAEAGVFKDPEGIVNYYFGKAGDALYFNGNVGNASMLYYMEQEDFDAGNYEFHLIEFD